MKGGSTAWLYSWKKTTINKYVHDASYPKASTSSGSDWQKPKVKKSMRNCGEGGDVRRGGVILSTKRQQRPIAALCDRTLELPRGSVAHLHSHDSEQRPVVEQHGMSNLVYHHGTHRRDRLLADGFVGSSGLEVRQQCVVDHHSLRAEEASHPRARREACGGRRVAGGVWREACGERRAVGKTCGCVWSGVVESVESRWAWDSGRSNRRGSSTGAGTP